ncbi:uncharacterized protein LOC126030006 [Suncus etruscus]|uniref:uncharacterized protein LOC126030006 n=1 Tax=Suncus etruscus TaxID=109475 RepID=UPI00210F9DEF|nr:uncharacterized protein LOC126030006 [Suncus etruscus]
MSHFTPVNHLFLFQRCQSYIEPQNLTSVSAFFLMGLSDDPDIQPLLFGLFLSMYLIAVSGNIVLIIAVCSDPHLHTPMYFFLCNLSLADICFISTTVPKMLMNLQTHSKAISYTGCLSQMSFLILFGCMDGMLLTVMAYDRFIAICHPLHYSVIMNPSLCSLSVLISFLVSLLDSQLHNLIALQLTCFKDVEVSNFFCDPSHLLHLACSVTFTNNMVIYFVGAIFGLIPTSGILFSYYKIVSSILRVPSSGGRSKAFSTCGSHLSVVCLFYGTAIGVYLGSSLAPSPRKDMMASIMYTVVAPMLNPFIYSLRNRDIKRSLWKLHSRTTSHFICRTLYYLVIMILHLCGLLLYRRSQGLEEQIAFGKLVPGLQFYNRRAEWQRGCLVDQGGAEESKGPRIGWPGEGVSRVLNLAKTLQFLPGFSKGLRKLKPRDSCIKMASQEPPEYHKVPVRLQDLFWLRLNLQTRMRLKWNSPARSSRFFSSLRLSAQVQNIQNSFQKINDSVGHLTSKVEELVLHLTARKRQLEDEDQDRQSRLVPQPLDYDIEEALEEFSLYEQPLREVKAGDPQPEVQPDEKQQLGPSSVSEQELTLRCWVGIQPASCPLQAPHPAPIEAAQKGVAKTKGFTCPLHPSTGAALELPAAHNVHVSSPPVAPGFWAGKAAK